MIESTKEHFKLIAEIKALSDEIAAVMAQREKLKTSYLKKYQDYVDRETALINKRFALMQKRKHFEEDYESHQ